MFFYYLIFTIIASSLFFNDKVTRYSLYLFFLFLFYLLSFIRWECGTDWISYKGIFDTALIEKWNIEPLFYYLNYCIRTLSNKYTLLLFVEGTFIYLCLKKTIRFFSIFPLLSILAFFCLERGYIFFIRQSIAVSLCLVSSFYIYREKFKTALFFWGIAITFHYLAIAFVLMFFLKRLHFSDMKCILLPIVSFMLSFLLVKVIKTFHDSDFYLLHKLVRYANDSDNMFGYGGGLTRVFLLVRSSINRLLILFSLLFVRRNNKNDIKFNFIFNCNLVATCLYLLLAPIAFNLSRMTSVYAIMEIFVYPYYLKLAKTRNNKIIILIIIIVYLLLRLYSGLFSQMEAFVPFRTIFLI